MRSITHVIIHHTATPLTTTFESIRQYHMNPPNNWKDIGYHYVIESSGQIRLGRPIWESGAHWKGNNSHSIGVAVVGNFDDVALRTEQLNSLGTLITDLRRHFPNVIVKHHRQVAETKCPGRYLAGWLESHKIVDVNGN